MTGPEVRALRARLDLTQERAAEIIGVSRQGWQKWELEERECVGAADRLLRVINIPGVRERLEEIADLGV
jgi:DNA-binding transcriptional regulator YiaG